ncbi:hypothetical protein, partial [Bacillus subtilis]|uniref:hypothetical protein n=1 Tax=Bacillus subtilis TaxID=1423 RepID=UPI0037BEC00F
YYIFNIGGLVLEQMISSSKVGVKILDILLRKAHLKLQVEVTLLKYVLFLLKNLRGDFYDLCPPVSFIGL